MTLTLAERGAYITLLAYQWDHGRIPDDAAARARVLGCARREAARVWTAVVAKFTRVADGWQNPRLEAERQKQVVRRAALTANGRKGGRPQQPKGKANRNQKVKQTKTKSFQSAEPNENLNESLSSSSSSSSSEERVDKEHQHAVGPAADGAVSGRALQAFLARFCELYSKYRHGAKYLVRREKDIPLARRLLQVYPADRLEKLAIILLSTDHDWVTQTDRGIGILSTKASWLDGLLAEFEAHKATASHDH